MTAGLQSVAAAKHEQKEVMKEHYLEMKLVSCDALYCTEPVEQGAF
jgi:hypothetical protein